MRSIRDLSVEPDYKLSLTYADGGVIVVDFGPLIARGGVYTPLGDAAYFSQVSIGERGRYIEWPGDLDFCADALWVESRAGDTAA